MAAVLAIAGYYAGLALAALAVVLGILALISALRNPAAKGFVGKAKAFLYAWYRLLVGSLASGLFVVATPVHYVGMGLGYIAGWGLLLIIWLDDKWSIGYSWLKSQIAAAWEQLRLKAEPQANAAGEAAVAAEVIKGMAAALNSRGGVQVQGAAN